MSVDVFALHCDALSHAVLVGFRGHEQLSQPFEFNVYFTVPVGTDVRGAIGAKATLTAKRDQDPMAWHGELVSLRLLHQTAERALYHGLLVPKLWLLRQHVRSHVQTKTGQKVKDFTGTTLTDAGLGDGTDFEFHVNGRYPEEQFVCQYHESHLDFVHRWFEREGLYYFFEHESGDSGTPKMMIIDEHSSRTLLGDGRVRYVPQADGDSAQGIDSLNELHIDLRLLPASVTITDHNYANPAAPVHGTKPVMDQGRGDLVEYGYRVFDGDEAERLALVKAQSLGCRALTLQGRGTYLGFRPGYDFDLEEGPDEYPSAYQVIEVRHQAALSGHSEMIARYTGLRGERTYEVEVFAIPRDVQFRAPQDTPWPRIYGFEHGTVDGEATSPYAQIDEHGRYLVRIHFDTAGLPDGSTSTYLRMMQPHGGNPEGFHFPLRKGTEVMLAFLGGDPDRPVIASVAPDAHRPSVVTSRNHTQNVIRTGGGNHMVIEDQAGEQSIDLYSPEQKTNFYLGHPRSETFGKPAEEKSESCAEEEVACSAYLHTDGTIGFSIGADWWETVGANKRVYVGGNVHTEYVGDYVFNVDSSTKIFYNGTLETEIASGWTDTIVTGGVTQTIEAGGWKQEVTGDSEQTITGALKSKMTGGWSVEKGTPTVEWDIDDEVEIKAGEKIVLKAPEVKIEVTSFHGHWEPHKFEMIGLIEEFVGNKAAVHGLIEEAVGAEAFFIGAAAHFLGASSHIAAAAYNNHLAEVKNEVSELKTAVTALENKPTTIINAVTVVRNTAIFVIP